MKPVTTSADGTTERACYVAAFFIWKRNIHYFLPKYARVLRNEVTWFMLGIYSSPNTPR